jgi:hypothetical protein
MKAVICNVVESNTSFISSDEVAAVTTENSKLFLGLS